MDAGHLFEMESVHLVEMEAWLRWTGHLVEM